MDGLLIQTFAAKYPIILTVITALGVIVPIASTLANFTKTDVDNKVIAAIAKFVDLCALNLNIRKK